MSTESPFFLSKVECPICKTINEYETVKVGSYYENGRDTDFCPTDIKWRYPRYQSYNPLVFFTATCSNCYYTREFNNSFKEWKKDNYFRTYRVKTVKDKHLDCLATADSVVRSLGEAIDLSRYPNESAVIKLQLAIFDELLSDRYSSLDLGRFYLRIGWIYRHLNHTENPHTNFLRGLFLEMDGKLAQFRGTLGSGREELQHLARHLSAHFETSEIPAEVKSDMFPFRERFNQTIGAIDSHFSGAQENSENLYNLLVEYKTTLLGNESGGEHANFGRFQSFTEFLFSLKKNWNYIVSNELEALEKAVLYYKEAFAGGRDITPGNQQLQASYLIAELSRRIGDHDSAREYFNSTIKHGQEFIYQNRQDKSRTALARKILELAIEQGKINMEALKSA